MLSVNFVFCPFPISFLFLSCNYRCGDVGAKMDIYNSNFLELLEAMSHLQETQKKLKASHLCKI